MRVRELRSSAGVGRIAGLKDRRGKPFSASRWILVVLVVGVVTLQASSMSTAALPPSDKASAAKPAPVEVSESFSNQAAHPWMNDRIQDGAEILTPSSRRDLSRSIARLSGKIEIFVVSRLLEDLAHFEDASQKAFQEVVRQLDHYRVVVVFIGYSPDKRHGIIGTNLGAGVWNTVTNEQVARLFGEEDSPLGQDTVLLGVEQLVDLLESRAPKNEVEGPSPVFGGLDSAAERLPVALVLGLLGAGGFWFYRKNQVCPRCQKTLRTRVTISLNMGDRGRLAKRTSKCFDCGYTRRQSLIPSLISQATGKGAPAAPANTDEVEPEFTPEPD